MNTDTAARSPVHPEQWLDLIIASAAHRSINEAHRKLGDMLIQRYFVNMPDRYSSDEVAAAYFNDVLCVVASGIRGFSVVRDTFQTNWDALRSARDRELQRAERIDAYSPFKEGNVWQKSFGYILSLGVGGVIVSAIVTWAKASPVLAVGAAAVASVAALFGTDIVVNCLRSRRLSSIEKRFPAELLNAWEDRALNGYRTVLEQVYPLLIEVTHRYYPAQDGNYAILMENSLPLDKLLQSGDTDPAELLRKVIERHFAFKRKQKPSSS